FIHRQNKLNNMPWIRKLQEPEYIDQLKRLERTQKEVFNWAIKEKYKIKKIDIDSEFGHFFLALLRGEVKSLHEYIYKNTTWLNKKDSKN
ncbi:MAG: hypothetical protein NC820_06420, partial [Candidatus Omnitrophica bacterium]|nr:hypothetical protein [Candidatus Omnitrophota bacterium]